MGSVIQGAWVINTSPVNSSKILVEKRSPLDEASKKHNKELDMDLIKKVLTTKKINVKVGPGQLRSTDVLLYT